MSNHTLSNMSIIGVLLVVIGHSIILGSENIYYNNFYSNLVNVIYYFHMPLFFMISGFLFFDTILKYTKNSVLKKKVIKLLYPWIFLTSLIYPIKVLMSSLAIRPLEFGIDEFFLQFLFPWTGAVIYFWFLPTLFAMFCISILFLSKKTFILMFLLFVPMYSYFDNINVDGYFGVLNIGGVLHNYIFFLVGFSTKQLFSEGRKVKNNLFIMLFALFVLAFSNKVEMIYALMGIFLVYSLSTLLSFRFCQYRVFALINKYSFQIFLLSWFPQTVIRILCVKLHFNPYLFSLLSIFCGIVIPILLSLLLKKIHSPSLAFSRTLIGLNK